MANPLPPYLTANNNEFAFKTMRNRLPVILTRCLDTLHREWRDYHNDSKPTRADSSPEEVSDREEDAKVAVGAMSKLHYLLMTNKPLEPLEALDADDYLVWSKELSKAEYNWFDSPWFVAECYLYRKIADILLVTKHFQDFDPFRTVKRQTLVDNLDSIRAISKYLVANAKSSSHREWVELSLWGNRCDLSLKATTPSYDNVLAELDQLQSNIVVNDSGLLYDRLDLIKISHTANIIVDMVLDNAGFELFTDLCLLHYLTVNCSSLVKIRIHLKSYPWFVSDTLRHDFNWTLEQLRDDVSEDVAQLAKDWIKWTSSGKWELVDDYFWTLPIAFCDMSTAAPHLYKSFAESSLIIFKGDLNYRKLLADRRWPHDTPFRTAINGFEPGFLVALRTNKADLVCGVTSQRDDLPDDWLTSGQFAVIHALDTNSSG